MAESTLSLNYAGIVAEVSQYLGYGRALADLIGETLTAVQEGQFAQVNAAIRAGLRNFYAPPGQPAHEWSFLRPIVTITTVANDHDYDLPDDYAAVCGRLTIRSTSGLHYPIAIVGEGKIRELRSAAATAGGRMTCAAVRPKPMQAGAPQRWELLFWPTPDAAYTVEAKILVAPNMISAANPYPYGGAMHAQTILEACLAEAERQLNDVDGVHRTAFMERLAASIQVDKSQSRPEYVGMLSDPSTPESMQSNYPWNPMDGRSTYNGNLY